MVKIEKNNNDKSAKFIKDFLDRDSFCNLYRFLSPDGQRCTHFRRKPVSAARLDMFLVSLGMVGCVHYIVSNMFCSCDHSLLETYLQFDKFKCGSGLWCLNTKLLADNEVRMKI